MFTQIHHHYCVWYLLILTSVAALPLNKEDQQEPVNLAATNPVVNPTDEVLEDDGRGNIVTDMLTALFRQTIYQRIENLLLDPGKKSQDKHQIIQSAVDNYHKSQQPQQTSVPINPPPKLNDVSDLIGFWILESLPQEPPMLLGSTAPGASGLPESSADPPRHTPDDYHTEKYQLEDLFAK